MSNIREVTERGWIVLGFEGLWVLVEVSCEDNRESN